MLLFYGLRYLKLIEWLQQPEEEIRMSTPQKVEDFTLDWIKPIILKYFEEKKAKDVTKIEFGWGPSSKEQSAGDSEHNLRRRHYLQGSESNHRYYLPGRKKVRLDFDYELKNLRRQIQTFDLNNN